MTVLLSVIMMFVAEGLDRKSPPKPQSKPLTLTAHQSQLNNNFIKDRFDPGMGTYKTIELTGMLYPRANLLYVTSTNGGTHASGSWHFRNGGCAVDYGSGVRNAAELKKAKTTRWKEMDRQAAWWYARSGFLVEEVHTKNLPTAYGGGWYVKNSRRVSRFFYGAATNQAHKDHVHVAVATQAQATRMFVSVYQWVLKDLGYYKGAQDGSNGPQTKAAVKNFQRMHGLVQDGAVGPLTIKSMRAAEEWGAL